MPLYTNNLNQGVAVTVTNAIILFTKMTYANA